MFRSYPHPLFETMQERVDNHIIIDEYQHLLSILITQIFKRHSDPFKSLLNHILMRQSISLKLDNK